MLVGMIYIHFTSTSFNGVVLSVHCEWKYCVYPLIRRGVFVACFGNRANSKASKAEQATMRGPRFFYIRFCLGTS